MRMIQIDNLMIWIEKTRVRSWERCTHGRLPWKGKKSRQATYISKSLPNGLEILAWLCVLWRWNGVVSLTLRFNPHSSEFNQHKLAPPRHCNRNLTEETQSLRHHSEESFREWLRLMLLCIAALKKFYTKPDQHFCWRSNSTGEKARARNVQYSLPILCWYTITWSRSLQSQVPISTRTMISTNFLGRMIIK